MKKILLIVLAVAFVSSLCFAQPISAPFAKTTSAPVEIKIFTGKVDSVLIGDAAKGTSSKIVVVDARGKKANFVVRHATSINAKDGKVLTLNEITKGSKITVTYRATAKGNLKATAITLIE